VISKSLPINAVLVFLAAYLLAACRTAATANPATATARARRAIAQATAVARDLRETSLLDEKQATTTAQEHLDRLLEINSPISRFIKEAVEVYLKFSYERGFAGSALHDPLTLATILAPELLTLKEYHVDVDIAGGVSTGKTFADIYKVTKKPANMKVAMQVRGDDFIELFLDRMESLAKSMIE